MTVPRAVEVLHAVHVLFRSGALVCERFGLDRGNAGVR